MRRSLVLVLLLVALPGSLHAAEPIVRNVNIRGLQIGGATTLVVDGDNFGKAPRLFFAFAAKQELKPGSTDKQATFVVNVGDDVSPGYEHLRIATEDGVSAPVIIALDRMPQVAFAAVADKLPVALHGTVGGSAVLETKIQGKAKQKVLVEVEAHRLGGKLRPIVHLYGPDRLQLGWSWGVPNLFGDTRLEATLPADGEYVVSLHDAEYAAPAPNHFRMRIGEWSFADQVFPPVIARGKPQSVELVGMSTPVRFDVAASPAEVLPLAWPKGGLWSGPRAFVRTSASPEFLETPGKLQDVAEGSGVSGRLSTPYEEDRYRVVVTPGKKIRLEVFAERLGSPIDAALVIRNEKLDILLRGEDSPNTLDPVLEYVVPDKVTAIVVGVVDAQGRGGPRGIYRLTVAPAPPDGKAAFDLRTQGQVIHLPAGGNVVIPVIAERRGYAGKIDIALASLPPAIRAEGTVIPDGADGTLVTLHRSDAPLTPALTSWRGRGADGEERVVHFRDHPLERLQPWLATEIAVAARATKGADLRVDWGKLAADAALVPGGKLSLPVKVTRTDLKTTVKLTLLTSQNTPLVNAKPDPNKSLRLDKGVDLAEKATDADLAVLVPAELAAPVYDVTVQADLLAADKKTVLASAYAPVKRLPIRLPLALEVVGPPRLEVVLDAKKDATLKLAGKVQRFDYLKADVAVALTGLPAGIKADSATVKAGATDFALNIVVPASVAAGEFKNVKLTASAVADAKQPNIRVKSRDVDVILVVKSAAKK